MQNEVTSTQSPAMTQPRIINEQGHSEQAVLCVTKAMGKIDGLSDFVGAHIEYSTGLRAKLLGNRAHQQAALRGNAGAVLAWGNKPSAAKAVAIAEELSLPILRLEDGFLRSVDLGAFDQPLALVLDDQGIYYDARSPSRIERLIQQQLTPEQQNRAAQLVIQWREARVSKYNHCAEKQLVTGDYVLVVDQTMGDASIEYGLANANRFIEMLEAAVTGFPKHQVVVKTHPDVVAGLKQGHYDSVPEHLQGRFQLIGEDVHAPALIEHAQAVFCVTSQMGFEALLWGKDVYVFGMPFYAGWGLTKDALDSPSRRCNTSLEHLAHAALIEYTRYRHPESGEICQVEAILTWMAEQRRQREKVKGLVTAINWPRWKKPVLSLFLQGATIKFVSQAPSTNSTGHSTSKEQTVGWGARAETDIRVEDGFIRSVGLGADLTLPQSWVVDDIGIYYDATRPSRLEQLLIETEFTPSLVLRGRTVRELLLKSKVTKYNVGQSNWQRPQADNPVVLIPGQVESDASIQLGSPYIKTNLDLIKAVRKRCPHAYLVYKPHPDVLAGLRLAGQDKHEAVHYCDEIVTDQDMAWMLEQVDEVHTLTSLTGFEALMRETKVVCYGQPFYAGWGLTEDVYPASRRQRVLPLDALVVAALVLYPVYVNYNTRRYTTVELLIESLARQRETKPMRVTLLRKLKRRLLALNRF